MSKSRPYLCLVGLLAILLPPRPLAADPVRITSGSVEPSLTLGLARGSYEGSDFSMTFAAEGFMAPLALTCYPCRPGTTVSLSGFFNLPRASGTAVVEGTVYPRIWFDGMTGTFTSPSITLLDNGTFTATMPFIFNGVVSGYLSDPFISGFPESVFTRALYGQGTASATFLFASLEDGTGAGVFTPTNLRYDFSDAAPVPEPATMLLCGGGTVFLLLRRRLRTDGHKLPTT